MPKAKAKTGRRKAQLDADRGVRVQHRTIFGCGAANSSCTQAETVHYETGASLCRPLPILPESKCRKGLYGPFSADKARQEGSFTLKKLQIPAAFARALPRPQQAFSQGHRTSRHFRSQPKCLYSKPTPQFLFVIELFSATQLARPRPPQASAAALVLRAMSHVKLYCESWLKTLESGQPTGEDGEESLPWLALTFALTYVTPDRNV